MGAKPTKEKIIQEYEDNEGSKPFGDWRKKLDKDSAVKVSLAIGKVRKGNMSNVASVGGGVHEIKIDWGAGYRVYFGNVDDVIVLLLGGGTKKDQQKDIDVAKIRWEDDKRRRK